MRFNSIFLITILLVSMVIQSAVAQQPDLRPTINVSARATEAVAPDEILLRFSIRTRAKTAKEAAKENSRQIQSVVEYLKLQGVQQPDIGTERIQLTPIFSRSPTRVKSQQAAIQTNIQMVPAANSMNLQKSAVGGVEVDPTKPSAYEAIRSISVVIRAIDQFETVYLGIIERGVNSISNISTRSSKIVEKRAEVRLKAVAAAKEKAKAMANALGANLKSVISISEGSSHASTQAANPFGDRLLPPNSESLAVGTIEVASSVNVTFELEDTEL